MNKSQDNCPECETKHRHYMIDENTFFGCETCKSQIIKLKGIGTSELWMGRNASNNK